MMLENLVGRKFRFLDGSVIEVTFFIKPILCTDDRYYECEILNKDGGKINLTGRELLLNSV